MKNIEIIRLESSQSGVFGALKIDKRVFCVSLEPTDYLNARNKSCIPTGQYECQLWNSPKFGRTYLVMGVPNRASILFHPGNRITDTSGCIIVAQHWGKLYGDRAVLNSGKTYKEFMRRLYPDETIHLTIKEEY